MLNQIRFLPARESHYSRSQNRHKKYLDTRLSVSKMCRHFIGENSDLRLKVKHCMHSKIFNFKFNLPFAFLRNNVGDKRKQLNVDLKEAELTRDREAAQQSKIEMELYR